MLKIGEFSKMSKLTIKALRYYEEEGLIIPKFTDKSNSYRYYESNQLLEASRIISLKQVGLSIEEIKRVIIDGADLKEILKLKKESIKQSIEEHNQQLSKINYLLKEQDMNQEIFEKVIPACYVYYKEGIIEDYSKLAEFVLGSGEECLKLNPNIECVSPEYCFVNYLDGQYKEKDIKVKYSQAVIKTNKPFKENKSIKFEELDECKCICIYHKGPYNEISKSYGKILKYIEDNKLKINGYIRECYIDGPWNKDNEDDYLTELQIPTK